MSKMATVRMIAILTLVAVLTMGLAAPAIAGQGRGPAPNSGDGIPDGSGFELPPGQGVGGAPNSGDGIPDGSGW